MSKLILVLLITTLVGCTSTISLQPQLNQQTVVLSECLYSSEELYLAIVQQKGEVELGRDCDYLSTKTARQIAKLP